MKTLPELNSGLTDEGLSAEPMSELNSDAIDKVTRNRDRRQPQRKALRNGVPFAVVRQGGSPPS